MRCPKDVFRRSSQTFMNIFFTDQVTVVAFGNLDIIQSKGLSLPQNKTLPVMKIFHIRKPKHLFQRFSCRTHSFSKATYDISIVVPRTLFDFGIEKNIQPNLFVSTLVPRLLQITLTTQSATSVDHWVPRSLFAYLID